MLVCCLLYFFGTCIFRVKPVYPGTNTVHLQEQIGETTRFDNNFFWRFLEGLEGRFLMQLARR